MKKHNSSYRWVVFATILLAYCLIVSQRTAPGLITDQLMKEFGLTAAVMGSLASVQFLAYAGLQIPIGILSDRFGPNIFLISGTLLDGLGTVLYSLAQNESMLLAARLLVGIGDATIWVNVVLILSQWFRSQEFVSLLGFAGMSGSMGFLLATYPFSAWLSLAGWRMPFVVTGLILCIMGLALYGILVWFPKGRIEGIALIQPAMRKTEEANQKNETLWQLIRRIFTERQAWATFFCHFGLVGTYVGFIGSWAVPYGMQVYQLSRGQASQMIMVGLVGALVGAPLSTTLAKRFHSIRRPYTIVHSIVFLCWGAFFLLNGKPPFFGYMILFFIIGYGNGTSALTFAAVRQYFDIREVGVVSGFANTGGFLSAVLLPALFGAVLDVFPGVSQTGFRFGFLIPLFFSMFGILGGLLLKEPSQAAQHERT